MKLPAPRSLSCKPIYAILACLVASSYVTGVTSSLSPLDRPSCQPPGRKLASLTQQHQQPHQSEQLRDSANKLGQQDTALNATGGPAASATLTRLATPSVVSLPAAQRASGGSNRKLESSEKLRQLRQLLASNNYDAYLVGPNDEHASEYVTDYDRRLRFLSGFSGSNGYALVLMDRAVLFTDGRYSVQAEMELDCNWALAVSDDQLNEIFLWLKASNIRGLKLATDARLMSLSAYDYLEEHLKQLDIELSLISQDLLDVVWNNMASEATSGSSGSSNARPKSVEKLFVHPAQFAGNVSWQEKLIRLADRMAKLDGSHYVISQLDDVAWLLNLRGNDIPSSPLFKAYLFISRLPGDLNLEASTIASIKLQQQQQQTTTTVAAASSGGGLQAPLVLQVPASQTIRVTIYVDLVKLSPQVREHLHLSEAAPAGYLEVPSANGNNTTIPTATATTSGTVYTTLLSKERPHSATSRIQVEVRDYELFVLDFGNKMQPSPGGSRRIAGKLLLDAQANVAIHVLAKPYEDEVLVLQDSLVKSMKAVKSDGEVEGMRRAHLRDSLAISMLLGQLDLDIGQNKQVSKWSEVGAAKELQLYRSLMDYNKGESFDTISAYGTNAAIVHYQPKEADNVLIGNQSTFLLDSGGQYLDGTTDITRTVHFGEPSDFQRETYTRVLMGSIDLMSLVFFQPTRSPFRISDLLVRRHLFELGLDYDHGTGHGIGVYSLCHEAPALIEHYQYIANVRKHQQQQQQGKQTTSQRPGPSLHSEPILLQPNMFTSIEPGYYKNNDFGIRLENIVVTQRALRRSLRISASASGRQILRFEPISLVPFEPKLIKLELLSNKQKAWLNSYNLLVRVRLTSVINQYLEKIRSQRSLAASQRAPIVGKLTVGQQDMQQSASLVAANPRILARQFEAGSLQRQVPSVDSLNENQNFMKMDLDMLQDKLEQTHRWIMAKTELIQLDLPQVLTSASNTNHHQQQVTSVAQKANRKQEADNNKQSLEAQQKLMLTYMAGAPFNDQKAADALQALANSALGARSEQNETNNTAPANATSSQQVPSAANGNGSRSLEAGKTASKCSGAQCDLMLLEAMDPNRKEMRSSLSFLERNEAEPFLQDFEAIDEYQSTRPSSLLDLFKVENVHRVGIVGRWVLAGFGLIFIAQIIITSLICRRRRQSSSRIISGTSLAIS